MLKKYDIFVIVSLLLEIAYPGNIVGDTTHRESYTGSFFSGLTCDHPAWMPAGGLNGVSLNFSLCTFVN